MLLTNQFQACVDVIMAFIVMIEYMNYNKKIFDRNHLVSVSQTGGEFGMNCELYIYD